MILVRIRIFLGIIIFCGLLFCGGWTANFVLDEIAAEQASHRSSDQFEIEEISRELKGDALKEWAAPIIVYACILLLVALATLDEIRRSRLSAKATGFGG